MKKTVFLVFSLLFFLALSQSAFALLINSPSSISTNADFSISIQLEDRDSFYVLNVFLDSKKIGSLYSTNPPQFIADPFNGFVLNSSRFVDQKLVLSLIGLFAGEHEIRVEPTSQQNQVLDTVIQKIVAVEPLPQEFEQTLSEQLSELTSENQKLKDQLNALEQTNSQQLNQIERQRLQIEEQKQQIQALSQSVNGLADNWAANQETQQSIQQQLNALNAQLATGPSTSNPLTGFNLVANAPWIGLIVIIVIVGIWFVRRRPNSAY